MARNDLLLNNGRPSSEPPKKRKARCVIQDAVLIYQAANMAPTSEPVAKRNRTERLVLKASILGQPQRNVYDFYVMETNLGSGSYGVVRRCRRLSTGEEFACKSVSKEKLATQSDIEDIRREVAVMQTLSGHLNVVKLVETFEDQFNIHLIMELCKGGDLFEEISRLGRVDEQTAARIISQLATAVDFCHERNIVHRDLKPENLLLESMWESGQQFPVLKLGDFGLSVPLKEGQELYGLAGSPFYMAPEVVSYGGYGKEADIWSMGVILYILLCGCPPFSGENDTAIFESTKSGNVTFSSPIWNSVSEEAKSLIKIMLTVPKSDRPTVREVLWHPWLLQQLVEMKSPSQPISSQSCLTDGSIFTSSAGCEWMIADSDPYSLLDAPGTPDIWAAPSLSMASLIEAVEPCDKYPWLSGILDSFDD